MGPTLTVAALVLLFLISALPVSELVRRRMNARDAKRLADPEYQCYHSPEKPVAPGNAIAKALPVNSSSASTSYLPSAFKRSNLPFAEVYGRSIFGGIKKSKFNS